VLEYNGSEDMAIAALLHDAVEDQGGEPRLMDIRNRFGDRVADIVRSCSDTVVNSSAGQQKEDWRTRKTNYIAHLSLVDEETLLVSPSDKIHNARSILRDFRKPEIGNTVWNRFKASNDARGGDGGVCEELAARGGRRRASTPQRVPRSPFDARHVRCRLRRRQLRLRLRRRRRYWRFAQPSARMVFCSDGSTAVQYSASVLRSFGGRPGAGSPSFVLYKEGAILRENRARWGLPRAVGSVGDQATIGDMISIEWEFLLPQFRSKINLHPAVTTRLQARSLS